MANEFSCTYNFHFAGHDARLERRCIGGHFAAVLAADFGRYVVQPDLRGVRFGLLGRDFRERLFGLYNIIRIECICSGYREEKEGNFNKFKYILSLIK